MNNLVIPPSPNWYESKILACTTDNTIIYGSRNDIVIIKPKPYTEPAEIKIIPYAHYERIISVDTNINWGPDNKWAVSTAEDKIIKLWNMEDLSCKHINNAHTTKADKIIGAVFAGNNKIVAVSECGFITLWHMNTDEVIPLRNVFLFKVQITTLSACPHSPWLVAFGLKCGLVVVTDLRKTGKVLYKMRGHERSIVSLSWCPTPYNIFPKTSPKPKITTKKNTLNISNENNEKQVEISESLNECDESKDQNSPLNDSKECILDDTHNESKESDENLLKTPVNDVNLDQDVAVKTENISNKDIDEILKTDDKITPVDMISENGKYTPENIEKVDKNIIIVEPNQEIKEDKTEINDGKTNVGEKVVNSKDTNNKTEEATELKLVSNGDKPRTIEPTKEYLLASSSKGGAIFIWRAGGDGRKQMEMLLTQNRKRRNFRTNDKIWITICWNTPETLLSSSAIGEFMQWDLLKINKETNSPQKKLLHHDHGSNLFAIATPLQLQPNYTKPDEDNWRNEKNLFAWTSGQERFLLCTSLQANRTTLVSYPTIGGYVYCLASSPLDPTRLAVGIGDNTAKIWDLSRTHVQCIIMTNLWQKINSKVLSLAWHPTKETMLAYSTYEGRIGLINSNNTAKMPFLLSQYFRTGVNKIIWGPLNGNPESIGLYACGEGKLAIYDTENPLEEPQILDISNEYVATMSWKNDFSVLTVGTKSGAIFIYDLNLTLTTTIYTQYKNISCILWHPLATEEDSDLSPYNTWFAVATGDASVVIYDISREKTIGDCNEDVDNRIVAVLNGHSKVVRCLSWSSFEGAKLVSGGEDGLAQVWDVKTKTIISTFTDHSLEAILSVLWSPVDKNYIITGGKDNAIRIWNIHENKPMDETVLTQVRKERLKLKQETKKHRSTEENNDTDEIKIKRSVMLNLTAKTQNNVDLALEDCKKIFYLKNNDEKSDLTEKTPSKQDKLDVIKIFGDKNGVMELLELEQNRHIQKKNHLYNQHISLWKGDISETIKEAIKNRTVNPWVISMAPMVSPKLWQEACESYVAKLMDNPASDPIEVVSYLLACHKIEEAIGVLCNATLFREALALGKCRLSPNDPTIKDILCKWATFTVISGSYEIAAQCYIILDEYEEAAKALFKRNNPAILEFAIKLAEKSGNKDLTDAVTLRYNIFKNKTEEMNTNTENGVANSQNGADTKIDEQFENDIKVDGKVEEVPNRIENLDDKIQEEVVECIKEISGEI